MIGNVRATVWATVWEQVQNDIKKIQGGNENENY
jgi:hypothetical protein